LEQADHVDHAPTWQCTAHGWVLHVWDSDKDGHAAPPLALRVITERVLIWEPPLHFAEHDDHDDHPLTTQLTGQAWVLHAFVWAKGGHALPPKATFTVMVRVCVWEPPLHGLVHADQDDHGPTAQCTGHGWVLQACCSDVAGQEAPPWADWVVTARVRVCLPPPHLAEQLDQVDQPLTAQLTGHACVLHVCELAGGTLTVVNTLLAQVPPHVCDESPEHRMLQLLEGPYVP